MRVLRFLLNPSSKTYLRIVGGLLLLSLVISGCANKYFIPAFDTSEYKELKAGDNFTAPSEFLCVSREYANEVMGVEGIDPSKILKEKIKSEGDSK